MQRTCLVVGATGLVGSHVVGQLCANRTYSKVIIFVRRKLEILEPKVEQVLVDFSNLEQYVSYFNVDDVYCCLGTTINVAKTKENFRLVDYSYPLSIAKLAKQANVSQYLIITAVDSNPNSLIFYSKVKGELEEALQELKLPSLSIFRPSLLLGSRSEMRISELLAKWTSPFMALFLVGHFKKYRAIEASTVAKAMVKVALQEKNTLVQILESDTIEDIGTSK